MYRLIKICHLRSAAQTPKAIQATAELQLFFSENFPDHPVEIGIQCFGEPRILFFTDFDSLSQLEDYQQQLQSNAEYVQLTTSHQELWLDGWVNEHITQLLDDTMIEAAETATQTDDDDDEDNEQASKTETKKPMSSRK